MLIDKERVMQPGCESFACFLEKSVDDIDIVIIIIMIIQGS